MNQVIAKLKIILKINNYKKNKLIEIKKTIKI